jgi:hypothetical protein
MPVFFWAGCCGETEPVAFSEPVPRFVFEVKQLSRKLQLFTLLSDDAARAAFKNQNRTALQRCG